MENKILNYLKKNELTTLTEIINTFNNKDEITNVLKKLKDEYKIGWSNDNKIYYINNKYKIGSIRINDKGFGFVKNFNNLEEDFFVAPNSLNGCISTDEVVYTVEKESDDRMKANIEAISNRIKNSLVGELVKSKCGRFIDLIISEQGFKNYRIVMVNQKDFKLKPDLILKVKILDVRDKKLFVKIQKIIGNSNKAIDRIVSIAYEFNIKPEFSPLALKQADEVATKIDFNNNEIKRRLKNSLTNKCLVTIDGEDSKDLDDAVYVEKLVNGYKLIVAIADVSYYVRPFSELDNSALFKGNSVYLANKVIPMLPEKLSNGVCSLNPNEDKLCMVAEIDFSNDGKVIKKKVYESIMNSKARLTYNEVNEIYNGNNPNKRNDEILDMLFVAKELHDFIETERQNRGSIEFEISEPKIILDKEFNVIDIVKRNRGISEKLIENFMVSANEAVATIVFDKELPFIYRNHDIPKEESLKEWYSSLKALGINAKLNDKEKLNPKKIQSALNEIESQVKDETEREVINITLLRYMEKAEYGLDNIGHFGLASECYTHFTSPIRRYSDLLVHRYLKQYIIEHDLKENKLKNNEKFISKASSIINETERNAVSAEREVNKVCMCEFMKDKINFEYSGVISAVLKFGIFVQLSNCVEGLVHISELKDYVYDTEKGIMINKNNNTLRLGQIVKVKVKNADVKKRVIDFVLI
ncbi:ribonuclease R [Spiroplasma turonicum]|uniref:Ribonuclease R n=1 Tax=Spiroplasma turonicum TaxID=216946 RepID=A0A0K1P4V5_9MOLU|nr:ribonuclease R [Spiroplasma turonicum]AKU79318.1 ribonuclease R [Spiroplasma turonicum]ALX70341.1 ribonuclease R [Spiroplasma turonicum]